MKLRNLEKVDLIVLKLKSEGRKSAYARDIAKRTGLFVNQASAYMRQSDKVWYDKKNTIWIIL